MEGNPNTWSVDEKLQSRSSTQTPLSHSSQLELVGKNALSTFSLPEMQSFDSQSIFSMGFPDGTGLKKSSCLLYAGDMGSNPELARYLE